MFRFLLLSSVLSCAFAKPQSADDLDSGALKPIYAIPSFDGIMQQITPLPIPASDEPNNASQTLKRSRRAKKATAFTYTKNALSSVSANTPANLAAAIRKAQDCYQAATEQRDPAHFRKFQCDDWEALKALQDGYLSVTNQFVGYLPPNVLNSVLDASNEALSKPDKKDARQYLNHALKSVGASTSGESATLFVTLTLCLNNLVMERRPGLAVDCLAQSQGPLVNLSNMVNGVMQQFFGYLPPNLVIDAQKAMQPHLRHTKRRAAAESTMQELFTLSSTGPELVTCYQEMSRCTMETMRRSRPAACKAKERCTPLIIH